MFALVADADSGDVAGAAGDSAVAGDDLQMVADAAGTDLVANG